MKKLGKLKLDEISKSKKNQLKGGYDLLGVCNTPQCGCACPYSQSGGSSASDNSNANHAMTSQCSCACAYSQSGGSSTNDNNNANHASGLHSK